MVAVFSPWANASVELIRSNRKARNNWGPKELVIIILTPHKNRLNGIAESIAADRPLPVGSEDYWGNAAKRPEKNAWKRSFRTPFFVNLQMIAGTRSRNAVKFQASTPPARIAGTSRISGIAKNAKIAKIAETEKPNPLTAYETKEHTVKPGDKHPTAEISLIRHWSRTGPRQPSLLDGVCKRQRAGPRK